MVDGKGRGLAGCVAGVVLISGGWALAACSAESGESPHEVTAASAVPESASAASVLGALRERFSFERAQEPTRLDPIGSPWTMARVSALPLSNARIDSRGGWLLPSVPRSAGARVDVRLPLAANQPLELTDVNSGVAVAVALVAARPANAEVAGGYVVYRAALGGGGRSSLPGGTVLQRPFEDGLEDYVYFDAPPGEQWLDYQVALGDKVSGLRLVSNVLELLDASGTPRLRVRAPHLVDSTGTRHDATLAVSGCAVDRDPREPWGRPTLEPGARSCTVRVQWDGDGVTYPALLDPQWVNTTSMVTPRAEHTVTPYTNPSNETRLLIAGGRDGTTATGATEIYNPSSSPPTTAATGMMYQPRYQHTANFIQHPATNPAMRVVVAGGYAGATLQSSEYYNPSTGAWVGSAAACSAAGEFCLSSPRRAHAGVSFPATGSNDQGVQVSGGMSGAAAATSLATVEMYGHNGSGKLLWYTSWNGAIPAMGVKRAFHAATVWWKTGNTLEIVIAGGLDELGNATATTEIYGFDQTPPMPRPVTRKAGNPMITARAQFGFVTLGDYYSVALGGYIGTSAGTDKVEYLDASGWHAATNTLSSARYKGAAQALLASQRILYFGGNANSNKTDLYDKATNTLYPASNLLTGVESTTAPNVTPFLAVPTSGGVAPYDFPFALATGGFTSVNTATTIVEKWTPAALGTACTLTGDCSSLKCVDGVCCNSECSGACDSCATGTCTNVTGAGSPSCSPYVCSGSSPSCPSGCTSDSQCATGFYCNAAGACVAVKALGANAQCNDAAGADCKVAGCRVCGGIPGRCVDGYCCNADCGAACDRCNLTGKQGQCSVVPDATPGAPACSGNLLCDGVAATCPTACVVNADCASGYYCDQTSNPKTCKPQGGGTPCTTGGDCPSGLFCVDSVCCDTSCAGACAACNLPGKVGICSPVAVGTAPTGCAAGLLCDGSNQSCPAGCTSDAGCASGYYCASDSTCKLKKSPGATCNSGVGGDCLVAGCGVCGSAGGCVDGVCCDSACGGACDACNLSGKLGTCSAVAAGQPGSPSCSPYKCGASGTCATTCSGSGDCAPGYFCDGTNHCTLQAGVGNACSGPGQCNAGLYCVDGVCCTTDCVGACQACSAAKKGQGVNGICGPIAAGQDPDAECADKPGSTCDTTGSCDGNGKCALHPAGISCGTGTSCAAGQETSYQCNGLGACQPAGSKSCAPYQCNGSVCATGCTTDGECSGGYFCNTTTAKCALKLDSGATCTGGNQCKSSYCTDGVCCDKACTGTCYACTKAKKGSGDDGVCEPVQKGTDADNECAKDAVSTCQKTGNCDGAGSCEVYVPGTACGSATCVGNSAVGNVCNTFNECKNDQTGVACDPYVCSNGGCPTSCTTSAQCVTGYFCKAGACIAAQTNGASCAADTECSSGHCVDGYCCDSNCNGQCEACDVTGNLGKCSAVTGAPHGSSRPACNGTAECKGTCDGATTTTCVYPGATAFCTGTKCVGSVFEPWTCDGQGSCVKGTSQDCGSYACDATANACKTTCSGDGDCATGSKCNTSTGQCAQQGTTCKDPYTVKQANGQEQSCEPYKCVAGACQQQCTTDDDCAPGNGCNASNACVPSSDGGGSGGADGGTGTGGKAGGASGEATDDGGCGCSVPAERSSEPFAALVALLAAAGARRRGRARAGAGR